MLDPISFGLSEIGCLKSMFGQDLMERPRPFRDLLHLQQISWGDLSP